MEARKIIAKPASTGLSIREQLQAEIEKAPNEEILALALEFLLFLKSRYSRSSSEKQPPSTAASILKTLESIGKWEGDDFDECLELVYASRSNIYIATDRGKTQGYEL